MATFRQFTEGFYSSSYTKRSSRLGRFFGDYLVELEWEITVKIFDANRNLTNLTAEHRRTLEIDNVHVRLSKADTGEGVITCSFKAKSMARFTCSLLNPKKSQG